MSAGRRKETHVSTIAVLSQKGGVGKTATTANLGASLAGRGLRVLMVDFDPQADLSASWGLEEDDPRPRIEQFLGRSDRPVRDAVFEIEIGENRGSLALLPTAFEALRRQTARLLDGANRDLADRLEGLRGVFDTVVLRPKSTVAHAYRELARVVDRLAAHHTAPTR
jgi:chromosome partitioning protein